MRIARNSERIVALSTVVTVLIACLFLLAQNRFLLLATLAAGYHHHERHPVPLRASLASAVVVYS